MEFIKKIKRIFVYLLPAILFFSYHPVITLGSAESMNLELSIPLIWLGLFSIISLIDIPALVRHFKPKGIAIAAILPCYLLVSCLWTPNRLRGILTAGIFTLIVFSLLNIIYILKSDKLFKKPTVIKSLLFSGVAVSIFCWIQCILDLVGVSRDASLLCLGCTYTAFGFPHPNGFAIEPQFMGNLLIAPALLSYYLIVAKPKFIKLKPQITISAAAILTSTLFLTFSRGAIYAFVIAISVWLIATYFRNKKFKPLILPACLLIAAFCISLIAQGVFAAISPTSDNFTSGVTKAIHQLSLGRIDIRPEYVKTVNVETEVSGEVSTEESTFSGYVAESTDVRVNLTNLALETWSTSDKYLLIGTGIGGAGISLYDRHPELGSSKEIVQNEYASLLLELGIAGIVLIMFVLCQSIKINKKTINKNQEINGFLFALLFGYALTLLFFSGLPNALHIYLFPTLLFGSLGRL